MKKKCICLSKRLDLDQINQEKSFQSQTNTVRSTVTNLTDPKGFETVVACRPLGATNPEILLVNHRDRVPLDGYLIV